MPEHPTRGPSRRGIAAALVLPAAAVAAIFTASGVASGTTVPEPAQQQTNLPPQLSPGTSGTGGGTGTGTRTGTATGTATGTPTRTPTRTATGTTAPGAPEATALTCVSTRTGVPTGPSSTGTRTTGPTHTGTPTGTASPTGPTATGTRPSVENVPGAAQTTEAVQVTIRVGEAGGKRDVLVDQNGCALYLNTSDTPERTDVSPDQERTWIPIHAPVQVTGELDQSKVGTFTRPDGVRQATYNGHQLYRFAGDRAPGEAKGHGVDGKFHLINKNGDPVR
jgi:predicted lipoprotein with Yx(FWY)xxD motif